MRWCCPEPVRRLQPESRVKRSNRCCYRSRPLAAAQRRGFLLPAGRASPQTGRGGRRSPPRRWLSQPSADGAGGSRPCRPAEPERRQSGRSPCRRPNSRAFSSACRIPDESGTSRRASGPPGRGRQARRSFLRWTPSPHTGGGSRGRRRDAPVHALRLRRRAPRQALRSIIHKSARSSTRIPPFYLTDETVFDLFPICNNLFRSAARARERRDLTVPSSMCRISAIWA